MKANQNTWPGYAQTSRYTFPISKNGETIEHGATAEVLSALGGGNEVLPGLRPLAVNVGRYCPFVLWSFGPLV